MNEGLVRLFRVPLREMRLALAAPVTGLSVVLACGLAVGTAWSAPLASMGLRTTDATGCRLTDGRGFEAPTIVLMAGAYRERSLKSDMALKIIDVAIAAGCDIDGPDALGLSPLNAAILYNEPVLVKRFLDGGANPYAKIASQKQMLNGKDSFEFLDLLETRDKRRDRHSIRVELDTLRH
ncbi:hypothetical protein ACMYUJ_19785 [Stutzerimonas zhaodongensis]|uniref:hypothetical protein n=1 Tax=Stutzerimonas zhaodongensis TaxID=1176257 RepID=UPI0039F14389